MFRLFCRPKKLKIASDSLKVNKDRSLYSAQGGHGEVNSINKMYLIDLFQFFILDNHLTLLRELISLLLSSSLFENDL